MSELLKEFTIDRSKWACQSNNVVRGMGSLLEDPDGFKCCLGFYASACKMPTGRMIADKPTEKPKFSGYGTLGSIHIEERTPLFNGDLMKDSTTSKLISVNDNMLNNEEREKEITRLFAKHDIKVNFVGEYLKENV